MLNVLGFSVPFSAWPDFLAAVQVNMLKLGNHGKPPLCRSLQLDLAKSSAGHLRRWESEAAQLSPAELMASPPGWNGEVKPCCFGVVGWRWWHCFGHIASSWLNCVEFTYCHIVMDMDTKGGRAWQRCQFQIASIKDGGGTSLQKWFCMHNSFCSMKAVQHKKKHAKVLASTMVDFSMATESYLGWRNSDLVASVIFGLRCWMACIVIIATQRCGLQRHVAYWINTNENSHRI